MAGIYDSPLNQIMPQLMGGSQQAFSGTDPDWTALASMYGFRPSPFPQVGQQGQAEQRFLATMKSIMDQQMAGYGNQLNQLSPGDPMQALPNSMYNYMMGAAPLFTSPAGQQVAPAGTAGFFGNGYRSGPLPNNQSPLIQQYLSRMAGNAQPASAAATAATSPAGMNPTNASMAGGNTTVQNAAANNMAPAGPNPATAADARGGTDPNAALSSGAGRSQIAAALAQPNNPAPGQTGTSPLQPAQARSAERDNPNYRETLDANGNRVNGTPFNTGPQMDARSQALNNGMSNIGQNFSNLGGGMDQLAAAIISMLMGGRR